MGFTPAVCYHIAACALTARFQPCTSITVKVVEERYVSVALFTVIGRILDITCVLSKMFIRSRP